MIHLRRIMMVSVVALGVIAAAGHQKPEAQDQRPGPPGTVRVRVRLIPVDVMVTDLNGRPVADLKQEDFRIFENGREQEIRHFSIEKLTAAAAAPAPDRPAMLRKVPTLDLAPQNGRTFLILMGRGRNQISFKCVDDLIRFVRKELLPQDQVAVFAYNRATDFTPDREKIAQVLERYKKVNEKLESQLESRFGGLAAIYGSKELPNSFQSEIDMIFAPEGLASRRVPPQAVPNQAKWDKDARTVTAQANRSDEASSISPFDKLEAGLISGGMGFGEFASSSAATQQDVRNLLTCIEYLRYMEGEKHLLLFTEKGLFFPRGDIRYDMGIAAVANDARVVIDTIQTGGTPPTQLPVSSFPKIEKGPNGVPTVTRPDPVPSSPPPGVTWAIQSLREISFLTGGRASIYSAIGPVLDSINATTRVQYLLGYYPLDDTWDGKYRNIDVKVRRSGVKVYFRHGYYARDTILPYDREEFLAYSRIAAAAAYESDLEDIALKVSTAAIKDEQGQPQTRVDVKIDPGKIGFVTVGDRHEATLRVAIFYSNGRGEPVGEDWRTVSLKPSEESYRSFMQSGIPCSIPIPLLAAGQTMKVIVYDPANDRVGSKLVKIR